MRLPEQAVHLRRKAPSSRAGSRSTALIIFIDASESLRNDAELQRIDVQDSEQRIDLCLRLILRGGEFVRQIDPRGDVGHGDQHLRDRAVDAHPVKIELQIARGDVALAW